MRNFRSYKKEETVRGHLVSSTLCLRGVICPNYWVSSRWGSYKPGPAYYSSRGEGTAMASSLLNTMWLRVGSWRRWRIRHLCDANLDRSCLSQVWLYFCRLVRTVLWRHKLLICPARSVLNGSITKAGYRQKGGLGVSWLNASVFLC